MTDFTSMDLLNWIFIILTVLSVFHIGICMHMEGEHDITMDGCCCNFPVLFVLLTEGHYIWGF
jgi:hypothetical protein